MQLNPQLAGFGDTTTVSWMKQPLGASFTFQPGQRYAVLASVGSGTSLATITSYLQKKGFTVTYSCEPPTGCTRDTYNIDTWLTSITTPARSGERWVYAEGNFTGTSPWTVDATDSFPKTLVATYSLSVVMMAVATTTPTPTPQQLPAAPATPAGSVSSPAATVAIAGVALAGGGALAWWLLRRKS